MGTTSRIRNTCLAAAVAFALPAVSHAGERHLTKFDVRLGSLSLGQMDFNVDLDGDQYVLSGNGKTKGLAEWFAAGKADMKSNGLVKGDVVQADQHFISITEGKKTETLDMGFTSGDVTKIALKPEKKPKTNAKKYVLIEPQHLKGDIDPASALVVPVGPDKANDPNAVCNRRLKIFDGVARYDMALSYKTNSKVETKGYKGWAYVCRLKYVPVAGYKRNNENTQRMADNDGMEIWLAPIPQEGDVTAAVFTPIKIVVPTWLGTFTAEPEYFGPSKG